MVFDFRRYFHASIDDIGDSIPYRDLHDLIFGLIAETGSHLYADIAGFDFAMSHGEYAAWAHAEGFLNANRDRDESPDPFELPGPWAPKVDEAEIVTDDERADAEAWLAAHSAMR